MSDVTPPTDYSPGEPQTNYLDVNVAAGTGTEVQSAPGANKRIAVMEVFLSTNGTKAVYLHSNGVDSTSTKNWCWRQIGNTVNHLYRVNGEPLFVCGANEALWYDQSSTGDIELDVRTKILDQSA